MGSNKTFKNYISAKFYLKVWIHWIESVYHWDNTYEVLYNVCISSYQTGYLYTCLTSPLYSTNIVYIPIRIEFILSCHGLYINKKMRYECQRDNCQSRAQIHKKISIGPTGQSTAFNMEHLITLYKCNCVYEIAIKRTLFLEIDAESNKGSKH